MSQGGRLLQGQFRSKGIEICQRPGVRDCGTSRWLDWVRYQTRNVLISFAAARLQARCSGPLEARIPVVVAEIPKLIWAVVATSCSPPPR